MTGSLSMLALPLVTMVQLGLALLLFARPLPEREGYAARVVVTALLVVIGTAVATWVGFVAEPDLMGRYEALTSAITFGLVLVLMPLVVLWCREVSVWTAVWCASAAYTMQNLASGTGEFLVLVGGQASRWPAFAFSWALVFGACYLLLIRRLWAGGAYEIEDRRMLMLMLLVFVLVIGLDALTKELTRAGTDLGVTVLLRVMHGVVCVLFLFLSYETLFSLRLRSEVATLRALTEERERQYALSRETFAAVNARVHDMRHQVLRSLEAGSEAPLDRSLLAEVAREMDVYDLVVRTGCEALDTAVTERALLCRREGIELMCVADGTALDCLPPADAYALVGGLLDLAIASARESGADGVDLTVRKRGEMSVIHVEWEGVAPTAAALVSLRAVVERHDGTLTSATRDGIASMNALLPTG